MKDRVVGGVGVMSHTSKLEISFMSLALCMSIYCIFQINGALGETFNAFEANLTRIKVVILIWKFLLKFHLFGNCCKLALVVSRA